MTEKIPVDIDDWRSILDELESIETLANGIGKLTHCGVEVTVNDDKQAVEFEYVDRQWTVTINPPKKGTKT